ncbi:hypothetical protein EIP91_002968 [Steccherinum ochraceum]|uniref:Major facilitator superfamily (MFS) profile domain-containing protein n=1 Tax=Steccherinum ochraceum TaxID=92696 RepID=A0A4R0RB95_9APHY|nr:hypothetical protein EIP91_002968 [Steccherinum ochraceum]
MQPTHQEDATVGPESPTPTIGDVTEEQAPTPPASQPPRKGRDFWLSFAAIVVSSLLAALDLTAVSTILPTLTDDLNGADNFTWVGSAYALASAAVLPLVGGLADIFGRKPVMIGAVVLFCLGSALCGAAKNMEMMIGGRTVQGLGGGAIASLSQIIVSDLVSLSERGLYSGFISLVYSLAAGIGPIIGGTFAVKVTWRWLFYLNLPISGVSLFLVVFFLRVRTPPGSLTEKFAKIDLIGNLIVIAGTTLAVIGLTWGGTRYPWTSAQVLAPLIIGLLLLIVFVVYEAYVPERPTIPFKVLNNRTTYSGYITTFMHGITSISMIYYIPVYYQACHGASPIRSGVDGLPNAFLVAPFAMVAGIWIKISKGYRIPNATGWVFATIGFGLLSMLKAESTFSQWAGYQVLASIGTGMIFSAPVFPVMAPLPISSAAYALSFFTFLRTFANTFGITISSTILQNQLKKKLPDAFAAQFPAGLEIAYAAIPQIPSLPEPLQSEVKQAFAESLRVVWWTMVGISGFALLSTAMMKDIPMGSVTDETYGLDVKGKVKDIEGAETEDVKEGKANTLLADHLFSPSLLLAEQIERGVIPVSGQSVLELGSGCALPSLLCAISPQPASTVVITDYPDDTIMNNLKSNVSRNELHFTSACNVRVVGYDWGQSVEPLLSLSPSHAGFDIVILSDLLHFDQSHDDLLSSLTRTLRRSNSARAYVAAGKYTQSCHCDHFLELGRKAGLSWSTGEEDPVWRGSMEVSGGSLDREQLGIRKGMCRWWTGRWDHL